MIATHRLLRMHWLFPTLSRRGGNQGLKNPLVIAYFESATEAISSLENPLVDSLHWDLDEAITVLRIDW